MPQVDAFSKEVLAGGADRRLVVVNELVDDPSLFFPVGAIVYDRTTKALYEVGVSDYVALPSLVYQYETAADLPASAEDGAFAFVRDTGSIYSFDTVTWVEFVSSSTMSIPLSQKGAAGGVASLDAFGNVIQNPATSYVLSSEKGAANGVATLSASSEVVQRLAYEGDASGVATLDAEGYLSAAQDPEGVLNVLRYGAVGDGVANDTTALKNALSAAASAGGAVVFLPPGTYMVDDTLSIPSKTVLAGAGPGRSVIKAVPTTVFPAVAPTSHPNYTDQRRHRCLITTTSRGRLTARVEHIGIRDLTVDWSNCPADDGVGTGLANIASPTPIFIDYADYVTVHNVSVINGLETNLLLVEGQRTVDPTYRGTNFSVCQSRHVYVSALWVGSSQYRSIEVKHNSQDVTFVGCTVESANPWRHGLEIFSGASFDPDAWSAEQMGPVRFLGCTFHALKWPGESASRQFDILSLHSPHNVTIEGCHFRVDAHKWGFVGAKVFGAAKNIVLANNTFDFRGEYDPAADTWTYVSNADAITNERGISPIQLGDTGDGGADGCENVTITGNTAMVYSGSKDTTRAWLIENPTNAVQKTVAITGNVFRLRATQGLSQHLVRLCGAAHSFVGNIIEVEESNAQANGQWLRIFTTPGSTSTVVTGNTVRTSDGTWDSDGGVEYAESAKVAVYDNAVWDTTGERTTKSTRPFDSGSFDPTLEGTTGDPSSVTYGTNRAGYWYRVGNLVHLFVDLDVTSYTGGTGQFRCGGLPFVPNTRGGGMSVLRADYVTFSGVLSVASEGSGAKLFARSNTSAAEAVTLNLSAFATTGFRLAVTGTYVAG